MKKDSIKPCTPNLLGWLEAKLDDKEMDYLWRCIKGKKESMKHRLAGQISGSYRLVDRGDWFWINTIKPLAVEYERVFSDVISSTIPSNIRCEWFLADFWVNYQKQGEFNPVHNHTGGYSFVIWMKIPYEYKQQNQLPIARESNLRTIGNFYFTCMDSIAGRMKSIDYNMDKSMEGTILLFPSGLTHGVYPFYNCDEDRISISGNLKFKA